MEPDMFVCMSSFCLFTYAMKQHWHWGTHSSSLCLCDRTMVAAVFSLLGRQGGVAGERSPGVKCVAAKRRRIPQKFLRGYDAAKIFLSPQKRQGHKVVRKIDELLSINCWYKPPQALAGLKSTSVIRSSHHLEEKQMEKRRHNVKDLRVLFLSL